MSKRFLLKQPSIGRRLQLLSLLAVAFCTAICARPAVAQTSGANQWTWMGGSSTVSGEFGVWPGVYGTKGAPAPTNIPPTRVDEVTWTSMDGRFWLFGGLTFTTTLNYFNDLWEFDPATNEWTWVAGDNTVGSNCPVIVTIANCGQPGVYGTLGTPAATNSPGSRQNAQSWTDATGHLWLYGGLGFDAAGNFVSLDDLWEFDISTSEWTWIAGDSTVPLNSTCNGCISGVPPVPGIQGTASPLNTPGSLWLGTSWTDENGNFWLFSGWGETPGGNGAVANDLWELNPSSREWTWVGGSPNFGIDGAVAGIYGTLGTPAPGNFPGTRWGDATWVDASGNLWLAGGQGYDSTGSNEGILNDVWKFNPVTSEWAWMGGSSTFNCADVPQKYCHQPGVYGALGQPSAGNIPGSRYGATSWKDNGGNLWLFGGNGFDSISDWNYMNDLWEFSPATNEWAWMSGSSNTSVGSIKGVYGTVGVTASSTVPGIRSSAASWTDNNGNLWLWGGTGIDSAGVYGYENDLWKYQPSSVLSFALSGTAVTVTPGTATGNTSTITITPTNGFTGSVALSATVTSSPAGAVYPPTLSFGTTNPVSITGGGAGMATLAITTTASSTGAAVYPNRPTGLWLSEGGAAVLACFVIFGASAMGGSARRRRGQPLFVMLALIIILVGGALACGGGSSGNGGGGQKLSGTTSGSYTITVSGTSGSITQTTTIALTVQ